MDDFLWFILLFGAVFLFWIYKVIKHRGVRGAMFGAEVGDTVGEVSLSGNVLLKQSVKVLRLEGSDSDTDPYVGLELRFATIGAWEMRPVSLTREQARELGRLISKAAE